MLLPAEASFADGLPPAIDELEKLRDEARTLSDYFSAGKLQQRIERQKNVEERSRLTALTDRHASELLSLEQHQAQEYREHIAHWEHELIEVDNHVKMQERSLSDRHANEQTVFSAQCEEEALRPKWSATLLNLRVQEEHLIRQKRFPQAHKVKAAADELEAREYHQAVTAMKARQQLDLSKLLSQQRREVAAQQNKLRGIRDEKVVAQEKDLDKLLKKIQAARATLARSHAQERLALEAALKGWFNAKKLGLPPSPLISPSHCVLPPGQRVGLNRPRQRPETAPGKLVQGMDGSVSPASAASTPSAMAGEQWGESPTERQLPGLQRKPWEPPSSPSSSQNNGPPYSKSVFMPPVSSRTSALPQQQLNGGAGIPLAARGGGSQDQGSEASQGGSSGGINRALMPKAQANYLGIGTLRPGSVPAQSGRVYADSHQHLPKPGPRSPTRGPAGSYSSAASTGHSRSLPSSKGASQGSNYSSSQPPNPQYAVMHK